MHDLLWHEINQILNRMLLTVQTAIIPVFGRYFDSKPDQAFGLYHPCELHKPVKR